MNLRERIQMLEMQLCEKDRLLKELLKEQRKELRKEHEAAMEKVLQEANDIVEQESANWSPERKEYWLQKERLSRGKLREIQESEARYVRSVKALEQRESSICNKLTSQLSAKAAALEMRRHRNDCHQKDTVAQSSCKNYREAHIKLFSSRGTSEMKQY